MTPRSSSLSSRLIASIVFAGLPLIFLILTALNVGSLLVSRQQTIQEQALLDSLSARLDVLDPKGAVDTSALYLSGTTPSLAAAELRKRMVTAIAEAGGNPIESRGVEPTENGEISNSVLLGATLDIDNAGLARLLYGLESGLPIVNVQSAALRRNDDAAQGDSDNPSLRVDLVVEAFRRSAAP